MPAVEPERIAIVGAGRVGRALTAALSHADGPFGRGFDGRGAGGSRYDVVVLAVPDSEIATAAAAVGPGPIVGHCAGAVGLDALAPHEAFGLHPLMTVTGEGASFRGAAAAVAGTTARALATARRLADALGMRSVEIADEARSAYHAAASMASNFLVTLEAAAETVMATASGDSARALLGPLVRATVENWITLGPERALTGPIARGDEETVARQRAAVARTAPQLLGLFDTLADATRALAGR